MVDVYAILTAELLAVGLAGVFLTPLVLILAVRGVWPGLGVLFQTAAWGGVVIVAVLFAKAALS